MHEFGLCQSIIDAVERRAAGRQVTEVRLRVGALHRVVQESMAQAFTFAAACTVAEGAAIVVVTVPVQLTCEDCAQVTEGAELLPTCPACGSPALRLTGGDELLLESIRLADTGDGVTRGSLHPAGDAISEADDGHTHSHGETRSHTHSPVGA